MELVRSSDTHECIMYSIGHAPTFAFKEAPPCLEQMVMAYSSLLFLRACTVDGVECEELLRLQQRIGSLFHEICQKVQEQVPINENVRTVFFKNLYHCITGLVEEGLNALEYFAKASLSLRGRCQVAIVALPLDIHRVLLFIQRSGPVVVLADIGTHRYKQDPLLSQDRVGNRPIHYFPKGSEIVPVGVSKSTPAVLLIGADREKGRLYFHEQSISGENPPKNMTFMLSWRKVQEFVLEAGGSPFLPLLHNPHFDYEKYD